MRKTLLKLRLVPRWLTSTDFRLAFTSGVSPNSVCFERELLDHYRLRVREGRRTQSARRRVASESRSDMGAAVHATSATERSLRPVLLESTPLQTPRGGR